MRFFIPVLTLVLFSIVGTSHALAQSAELMKSYRQYQTFKKAGKYREAIPHARRALELGETEFGLAHKTYAILLNNLAELYKAQGRYGEAEPLYKRALTIKEKALGADHPSVATSLNNLAALYRAQGRYGEAEPLYKRALTIKEKALGPEHPSVATSLNNLAELYKAQGRYGEAEPLYKRALTIKEKALGADHPSVATSLNNLALLYRAQGRYSEAEPLYKRSLTISEKALGPEHPSVATSLNNLAELYKAQGRYGEAEPLYKRDLAITEKALGPDHPDVATILNNLAVLYKTQGRYGEAEPLYKRSLTIREKALGPDHPDVATSLNNLAVLYKTQGRYGEAEPLYKRSLTIREKALGADHPSVATILNNLAGLYEAQGRYGEAEPLYKRALAIAEKALGPEHPDVATSLNNLALLYRAQGRYGEAEPLYKRALAIAEKALGPEHPDTATSLNNLAALYFTQGDWTQAADHWRRATGVLTRRAKRGGTIVRGPGGKRKSEVARNDWYFRGLVKSIYRDETPQKDRQTHGQEMFLTAQWAKSSEAAGSLARMAARGAADDPALAGLIRERQDLVDEWQRRDKARSSFAALHPSKRDRHKEQENVKRLAQIDKRIGVIDARLKQEFPDYAAIARPEPLSIAETQKLLGENEALVLFLDTEKWRPTPEETFIWVVTKTKSKWVRSTLGREALQREVAALRCGLDLDGSWGDLEGIKRCKALTGVKVIPSYLTPLPFDLARAHQLYKALFGKIEDLIKDKHLLLVPSGALTQLPFQVLVTKAPKPGKVLADRFRKAAWLAGRNAISVLPSVSSLKALRAHAKASKAAKPLIGFANPLLTGNKNDKWHRYWAREAQKIKGCADANALKTAELRMIRQSIPPLGRGARAADINEIRSAVPLPDTANELCEIARSAGKGKSAVYLGAQASETKLMALNKNGALSDYRVLHFATHGALAGELSSSNEPGLILSPPTIATDEDDGYLSASDVAGLKLDANLVILSACNTAGGATQGAEALSGLARAFFYAGARSLFVSHWYVDSEATVSLITKAFAELQKKPKLGRAGALRAAMLSLIKTDKRAWHPSLWAPFVVVGEGAGK